MPGRRRIVAARAAARGVEHRGPRRLPALYEHWLARERWQCVDEALPLLVGIDPACWSAHLAAADLADAARAAAAALTAAFAQALDVEPRRVGTWAEGAGLELPAPYAALLTFFDRVLPEGPSAPPATPAALPVSERERILGAALALVTRFPADCRGPHGPFDGECIAERMLAQAAVWFPGGPPTASRREIAELLETYLS